MEAEQAAARKKTKQTLSFRHRLLAEVLKRVKPHFGCDEMRIVARYVVEALPHDLACRLARRHALPNAKDAHDWHLAEKGRGLYRKSNAAELAALIFEVILLGPAGIPAQSKGDDLLTEAATLYKIDLQALRASSVKDGKSAHGTETGKPSKTSKRPPQEKR